MPAAGDESRTRTQAVRHETLQNAHFTVVNVAFGIWALAPLRGFVATPSFFG